MTLILRMVGWAVAGVGLGVLMLLLGTWRRP